MQGMVRSHRALLAAVTSVGVLSLAPQGLAQETNAVSCPPLFWWDCRGEYEALTLGKYPRLATRTVKPGPTGLKPEKVSVLTLTLRDGPLVLENSPEGEAFVGYTFLGYVEALDLLLIGVTPNEGTKWFLMVDRNTGAKHQPPNYPHFSPNLDRFVTLRHGYYGDPNLLSVWKKEGEGWREEWSHIPPPDWQFGHDTRILWEPNGERFTVSGVLVPAPGAPLVLEVYGHPIYDHRVPASFSFEAGASGWQSATGP